MLQQIGPAQATTQPQNQNTHGAISVAIVFGLLIAIYVPFYIRAKRRGDLGDAAPARKMRGTFCERPSGARNQFARKSFRYKKSGRAWVLVGCPKGQWDVRGTRCRVGLRAYKVLAPAKGRRCPRGTKRISK